MRVDKMGVDEMGSRCRSQRKSGFSRFILNKFHVRHYALSASVYNRAIAMQQALDIAVSEFYLP